MEIKNTLYVKLDPFDSPFSVQLFKELEPILEKNPQIEVYDVIRKGRPEWLPLVPVYFDQDGIDYIGPKAIYRYFMKFQEQEQEQKGKEEKEQQQQQKEEEEDDDEDDEHPKWTQPITVGRGSGGNDDTIRRAEEMERRRQARERGKK